ncbi:MAG: hypothetical protein IKV85_07960 [Ruminococcus sp.]|nr:hypothetical protein [Ruminococcus sp.]
MTKLLRACIRRYTRSIIFWIAVVLTLGLGISIAHSARTTYYDDAMVLGQMLVHAIMISWIVGKEFKEGIFKNKTIVGHSKGSIFLSELISGVGIAFVLYFLCGLFFILFNWYEVPLLPTSLIVKIFIDYVLLNMGLAAVFVTISCLFSQQAIIAIANIFLVLSMWIGCQRLYGELSQPQYIEQYETINTEWIDENGNIRYREEKVEGSEYLIDNPTYVGGTKRVIYETIYNLSPYGHIIDFVYFNMDWHGYYYFVNELAPELGMTGEELWDQVIGDNEITEETVDNFDSNLLYSCILLILAISIGYIGFRKKELK